MPPRYRALLRLSQKYIPMPEERLQKILAKAGLASRRNAEELIRQGKVTVDGKVVTEMGVPG